MTFTKLTALVYCGDQFGLVDGKTAAGLVRHSETYKIVGVIDRASAGQDAGEALGEAPNGIPIFADLATALAVVPATPNCYIYGKAPLEAYIPIDERLLILEAMTHGMDIINGLHQFFSEDPEFAAQAVACGVQIKDVRKPPKLQDSHVFTGRIGQVTVPVVAVLGTDCACGKMTTAVELNNALNLLGLKSVMIATGQTSLMQGARYGVSMDALVAQFAIGEIEHAVLQAVEHEQPDIILVEGQSSVSHPAFMSSIGILKGSLPAGVILQHPPGRKFRCDFPTLPMPTLEREIELIESISPTKVLAITLSHEGLPDAAVGAIAADYEQRLNLPTMDVLHDGCEKLIQALADQFPQLNQKINQIRMESKNIETLISLTVPEAISVIATPTDLVVR